MEICVNNMLWKMESKNELKEIDIKNHTNCYFDDLIIKLKILLLIIF